MHSPRGTSRSSTKHCPEPARPPSVATLRRGTASSQRARGPSRRSDVARPRASARAVPRDAPTWHGPEHALARGPLATLRRGTASSQRARSVATLRRGTASSQRARGPSRRSDVARPRTRARARSSRDARRGTAPSPRSRAVPRDAPTWHGLEPARAVPRDAPTWHGLEPTLARGPSRRSDVARPRTRARARSSRDARRGTAPSPRSRAVPRDAPTWHGLEPARAVRRDAPTWHGLEPTLARGPSRRSTWHGLEPARARSLATLRRGTASSQRSRAVRRDARPGMAPGRRSPPARHGGPGWPRRARGFAILAP